MDLPERRPSVPDPAPLDLQQVHWDVVTPDTLPDGADWALFALTADQYERLSLNIAELLRWVREAKWRLDYYSERLPEDVRMEDGEQ